MKKTFVIITVLLVCLAAAVGFGISIAARIALLDIFFSLTPTAAIMGEANILVLGVDDAFGHRSDTIMVLHINPDKKEAAILSIPRDTIVTIPGRGLDKANHAYAYGGVELARRTAAEFLQVEIPYYITVNLAGIAALIDQIGGVTIDVEKRMYYVDYAGDLHIDLQPGRQKLNGKQAMGYLRFRHTDNDFARIGRQQQFVNSVAAEIMRRENLIRSPNLFISLLQCVQTNLNSRQVLGLSLALRGVLELRQFSMNMVPGTDLMVDKIYYWKPDEAQVKQLVERHLAKKRLAVSPGE
ncbi:MAG: LCP family protein [Candidatus Margulisiibacteriota bacterium]